jgi:F0F1-type ATP synthase assembly protein I
MAIATYAVRKGLRDIIVIGVIPLAAIGLTGYAAFWIWFVSPRVGHAFSVLLPFASGAFFFFNYKHLDIYGRRITSHLGSIFALIGAASLLIVAIGFLRGGFALPNRTAAERFHLPAPRR